ncbi:hypothetical protein G7Y79_00039g075690 [Physcia stellaris]|nr:hypothetical protein G7Y79_00039g075690 [Physcia stellaris]
MWAFYQAVTADVISTYAFGEAEKNIDKGDLGFPFFQAMDESCEAWHWILHIGWLAPLLEQLPMSFLVKTNPAMAGVFKMQERFENQIEEIRNSKSLDENQSTVFHGLLNSSTLSDADKSTPRLKKEAYLIIGAGLSTTAHTLTAITYHLLANPPILRKLKAELAAAILDPSVPPTCKQVDSLPYLTGVVQEGLRMHPGATLRQQRVAPDEDLVYVDKGTGKRLEEYFPKPDEFRPERWLEDPTLDRINLAYQELHLVLASIFRIFNDEEGGPKFELYDTTRERDIDMDADLGGPYAKPGSLGLRVRVVG